MCAGVDVVEVGGVWVRAGRCEARCGDGRCGVRELVWRERGVRVRGEGCGAAVEGGCGQRRSVRGG